MGNIVGVRSFCVTAISRGGTNAEARIFDSPEGGAWKSGAPKGPQTPGLMARLAGVGYGLLCIAATDQAPCPPSAAEPKHPRFVGVSGLHPKESFASTLRPRRNPQLLFAAVDDNQQRAYTPLAR